MNLLFIQGGSRLKLSDKGLWYTDPNFTAEIWNRYLDVCDKLTILLRRERKIYEDSEARSQFNVIPQDDRIEVIALDDLMLPKWNYLNYILRRRVKKTIFEAVENCDKAVIRSNTDYTYYAYQACKQYDKAYFHEVTGFAYEGLYYQSFMGKVLASKMEDRQKLLAREADYALYVTEHALQKRYPSNGKMLGCSDVNIGCPDEEVLKHRLDSLMKPKPKIVIGTCGRIADKNKGQHLVIKALAALRDEGVGNIEYQLVGFGDPQGLQKLADEYGVGEKLKFIGGIPYNKMMEWYDNIDIYVQPSYSEGLSRAIVEAMSRACPVICSDVGGNSELVDAEFLFPRGNIASLAVKLHLMMQNDNMGKSARMNFEKSKSFERGLLDTKRHEFFMEFISSQDK